MEEFARKLRRDSSDAELRLWHFLRNRHLANHKFRRQHPFPPYVVDFVCIEETLIVELDGGQHLGQVVRDEKRTAFLEAKGYRVIRFWNDDVLIRTELVLEVILRALTSPHPNPLPARGARG